MSNSLKIKHLLGLETTPESDIDKIIDVGFTFREILDRPIKKVPTLSGKNIVNEPEVFAYAYSCSIAYIQNYIL